MKSCEWQEMTGNDRKNENFNLAQPCIEGPSPPEIKTRLPWVLYAIAGKAGRRQLYWKPHRLDSQPEAQENNRV